MAAVGVKASETKSTSGCQNQKCENTPMPTMAGMILLPVRLVSAMVTLRPPASSRPVARIAPNFVMVSSCLSPTTFFRSSRCLERREERALSHIVYRVGEHGREQVERLLGGGAGARDADRERRAVAHMRVVRLGEQLHHAWALRGRVSEHKADSDDGSASDVVRDIGNCDVQTSAQRRVGAGACVRKGDGIHGSVAQDGVLLIEQRGDKCVGLLFATVHAERNAERKTADDLLVRGVVRVAKHFLDRLGRGGAEHNEAHCERRRLTRNSRVVE
eukprot:scaffold83119_cov31-Tisochrysis_lutea.AAC.3